MDDIFKLKERIRELETIAQEYDELKNILADAKTSKPLDSHTNLDLELDLFSSNILAITPYLSRLLGYSSSELIASHISTIEVASSDLVKIDTNDPHLEGVYECHYRHKNGFLIPMRVHQRPIHLNNEARTHYTLVDLSLRSLLVQELARRENSDFQFGEKLKILTEVSVDLGRIRSFDDLCRRSTELAITHLGFDRFSLWLLEDDGHMHGTFGVDEEGNIRDERDQSWRLSGTYKDFFGEGHNDPIVIEKNAPIYNNKSEIIAYGWHISVPIFDNHKLVGFIGADNFIKKVPLKDFQPELLRLYGITLGHLLVHNRERLKIRKLSDAIENSASMVAILDEKGEIEFVNQAFCRLFNTKKEDLVGHHLESYLPREKFPNVWDALSNNTDWHGELKYEFEDESLLYSLMAISAIQLNESINYILVQEDITDIKLLQEKAYHLQHRQDRFELLDDFLQDIGHEFRTPLSIISTQTYIVNKKTEEVFKDRFETINAQVNYIHQMVNSMLDIIRLSRGAELKLQKIKLNEFVTQVVSKFEADMKKKNLSYHVKLLPEEKIVAISPSEFGRALGEIIKNAIQFTDLGGQISIYLKNKTQGTHISIQDTGIGIDKADVQKIFDYFYRGNKARTTRGIGLGLSITLAIINAHNGDINITSELAKGSNFEIILPHAR